MLKNLRRRSVYLGLSLLVALLAVGVSMGTNLPGQLGAGLAANSAWASLTDATDSSGTTSTVLSQQKADTDPDDPWGIKGFDCSRIQAEGIDKQMNFRAGAIMDHCSGKTRSKTEPAMAFLSPFEKLLSPFAYGGTDRDLITQVETGSSIVQSESWVWGHNNTVVATYNDSGGGSGQICGVSYSTDGGVTFTRVSPSPFTGLGACSGDPFHFYSVRAAKWYAQFFAGSCGGAIGQWESTNGITWSPSGCVISTGNQDRFSGWVDNNPASPFYGRQYASSNDFAIGGGAVVVAFSTNDGVTWSAPTTVFSGGTIRRNVQMTGSLGSDGTVFIETMDEGGGGLNGPRQNYIFRSTNGGVTWTQFQQNAATFLGPGRGTCGYFAGMYTTPVNGYWRHMGWGQPGVGPNNVVHYAYADRPGPSDPGNIEYIRSTDNGATWSAPIQLNTDATTRAQWMPSLSVNAQGAVFVGWYDERNTTGDNYQRYGRASTNNGVSWLADDVVSDVVIPKPLQQDPGIQPCYAGDYDYAMFSNNGQGNEALQTWTDGRVSVSGSPQQDVYFDKITVSVGTPTPTHTPCSPSCTPTRTVTPTFTPTITLTPTLTQTPCGFGSNYAVTPTTGAIVPGTIDTGSGCDDCLTAISLPFTFNLYGQAFNSVGASSNGNLQFISTDTAFSNTCLPVVTLNYAIMPHWDDLNTTDNAACPSGLCGIFTSITGSAPNRILNIEWRAVYYQTNTYINFEARLYENPNPSRFDFIYGTVAPNNGNSATVGVQRDTGTLFTEFSCNTASLSNGFALIFVQPSCATLSPTRTFTRTITPTPTLTPTLPPPTPCAVQDYSFTRSTGAPIVAGTTDTGNHTDDGTTAITLPFNYIFYGSSFYTARVSSNGTLQFSSSDATFSNSCLPVGFFNNAILPHWDDLRTDQVGSCTSYGGVGCGIFTSVTGSAPNRIFNIEWRAVYYSNNAQLANFEVRLYEGQNRLDLIYGTMGQAGSGATVGVQRGTGTQYTHYSCDLANSLTSGLQLAFTYGPSGGSAGAWTVRAPFAADVYGAGGAADNTYAYAGGGYSISAGGVVNTFARYNPVTNLWNSLAVMPTPAEEAAFIYSPVNNKVYAFGGYNTGTSTVFTATRIYDVATNVWSIGAPMPVGRQQMTGGYYNGRIYLAGGYTTNSVTDNTTTLSIYDVLANTWSTGAVMPAGFGGAGGGVVGDRFYVGGGRDGSISNRNTLYEYDITANTWVAKANLTSGVNVPGSAVSGGKLWVFGGGNPFNGTDDVSPTNADKPNSPNALNITQIYDPATNTWSTGPNLNVARSFVAGASVKQYVVSVGGYTSTSVNTTEVSTTGCASILVGHVAWQGRPVGPSAFQQMPITLTLKLGSNEFNYSQQSTDINGFFTVPVVGLPNGTYNWRVKGPYATIPYTLTTYATGYLANAGTVSITGAATIQQEMGTMRTGDCDNENRVVVGDFNIVKLTFGRGIADSGYDNRADFTGDQIVSAPDFNLIKQNFSFVGAPPSGPRGDD